MTEMNDATQPNEEKKSGHKIVRSDSFITQYVNQVQIGITPFDFQFVFGKITGIGSDTIVEELVSLYMSPQHAKAMLQPLIEMILRFEDNFGVVNAPETDFVDIMLSYIRKARDEAESSEPLEDGADSDVKPVARGKGRAKK